MDLVQGFHQITVAETSRDKTTCMCVHMARSDAIWAEDAPALFQNFKEQLRLFWNHEELL